MSYENGATRVLIVDDSKFFSETMLHTLEDHGFKVMGTLENAANAVVACLGGTIDLVLMDICTADDESGLAAAARIKRARPRTRVVIMTSMPEHTFIRKARAAGCDGFWYKEYGNAGLMEVIGQAMRGEPVYPEETPEVTIMNASSRALSARELDVIHRLASGYTYNEIAESLDISTNTVKYHVKNLLAKTGCRNALQLAVEAVTKRLVLPKY